MACTNSRGQSSLELALIILTLTTFVFVLHSLAWESRTFFKRAWLSQEVRR